MSFHGCPSPRMLSRLARKTIIRVPTIEPPTPPFHPANVVPPSITAAIESSG